MYFLSQVNTTGKRINTCHIINASYSRDIQYRHTKHLLLELNEESEQISTELFYSQSVNVTSGDDIRENEENTDGMMQHTNVTRPPGQTGSVSTGLRKQLIFVFHVITHWKY